MDSYSYWETVDKEGDEKHYSSCYTPATDKSILIEWSEENKFKWLKIPQVIDATVT